MVFGAGLALYLTNSAVGLLARFGGMRFGIWHHLLYGLVFASTVLALVLERRPWLILTVVVLAAFPRARPSTLWHPLLAAIGLCGYLAELYLAL